METRISRVDAESESPIDFVQIDGLVRILLLYYFVWSNNNYPFAWFSIYPYSLRMFGCMDFTLKNNLILYIGFLQLLNIFLSLFNSVCIYIMNKVVWFSAHLYPLFSHQIRDFFFILNVPKYFMKNKVLIKQNAFCNLCILMLTFIQDINYFDQKKF